jgi:hypothetical protein
VRFLSWRCVVTIAWMGVTAMPAPVAAQRGQAFVRVNATVVDFNQADVIGVHGLTAGAASAPAGVTRAGEAWRITTGGSAAVEVRLEAMGDGATDTAPAVSLCEVADGTTSCLSRHLPATSGPSLRSGPGLLLRLGASPETREADEDGDRSVRLTIDYVGI